MALFFFAYKITILETEIQLLYMTNIFTLFLTISFVFLQNILAQSNFQNKTIDSLETNDVAVGDKITLLEKSIFTAESLRKKMGFSAYLGDVYFDIEIYDKAYLYYTKALQIAQEKQLTNNIGSYYEGLGKIQLRIGNLESSLDFHTKAYNVFSEDNNEKRKTVALANIAVIQSNIGPIEKAILTLKSLSENKYFDNRSKANALMTLGNIYLEKLEIPTQAIRHYTEALALLNKSPDKTMQVMLLQNMAEAEIAIEEHDQALEYNKKSESILTQHPNLELQASLHKFYAEIHHAKKNYKQAYIHLNLQQKYNDSLANTTTRLKIANINTVKELEKHQADITLQKNKVNALERDKIIGNLKMTILFISLILIGLIAYLFIKKSKSRIKTLKSEKIEINDKLDFNKNKIEKMALNISTSQEYVASFSKKIKDILTRISDKKSKDEITQLLRDLQSYKVVNDNKKELQTYLNRINDEYLYNLTKKYPSLTKEEQHLCSLIFLNLKNKDIANLLNLSVRSIENKRYRIRKKMELNTTQSLNEALNNL